MGKQVVKLSDGLTLFASDIFLALSEREAVAVVVYKEGAKPLATTEGDGILFVAAIPKTAGDLDTVRMAGGWVEYLPDGSSRTAGEIVQAIGEGAMIVVLHKGSWKSLAIDDILFLARPINPPLLAMLRMAEESDIRAEECAVRLLKSAVT